MVLEEKNKKQVLSERSLMLQFKKLDFDSREIVGEYFSRDNNRRIANGEDIICDHVFGTTFLWRNYYNIRYAITDGCAVLLATIGGTDMFSFPMGDNIPAALDAVSEYANAGGINMYFCFICESDLKYFNNSFDIVFSSEEEDWSDYVYDLSEITHLAGRAFHRQKNHLNKFKKTHPDCNFAKICKSNAGYIKDYAQYWQKNYSDGSPMTKAEYIAINDILDNWDDYGMSGGYISYDNKIAGFTIGESVGDTVFIHIEKAEHSVPGAYQFLSTEYLKTFNRDKFKFVNREEDMGIEGLRKSKHSLHPVKMLKKYTLFCSK